GLGNRKYFDRSIDMAVANALANGEPLSLLMFDIDHFKSFNDSYGHLTGEILGRVTISVGVSMLKPGDDTDSLIERADGCLYAAKRNGRNRVICEVDPEYVAETQSQVA